MAVENQNTFFGNKNIDNATKLGAVALMFAGTSDTYAVTGGTDSAMVTFVKNQPVVIGIENSNLGDMAVNGYLNMLGLSSGYGNEADGIFRGVKSDLEICQDLADRVAKYNLTQNALVGLSERIAEKIKNFLEAKLNKDKNIVITKEDIENLVSNVKTAFDSSKKKQVNLGSSPAPVGV